jgi:hypothetical protein
MIKNLSGSALITYGADLPPAASAFDGTVFYKTTGTDAGLYLYSFVQDITPGTLGDQLGQLWAPIFRATDYVLKAGDVMTGQLETPNYFRVTQISDPSRILMGNQDSTGVNRPSIIEAANGAFRFGYGNTWVGNGGSVSSPNNFVIDCTAGNAGLQFNGGQVWHAGNDGAGSGLDADLLDGQDGSFYTNASNISSGTLNLARLPYTPVHQGGGVSQLTNTIYIGWSGASRLYLTVDSTNFADTWPININGNATTANSANTATTATTATNANFATTAGTANSVAWTNVSGRPTLYYEFTQGAQSPGPLTFASNDRMISGIDAVSSTDFPGAYWTGFQVIGPGGVRSMQLIGNWNSEETAPAGLAFRVNDDTSDTTAWSPWTTIWNSQNLTNLSQLSNGPGYVTASYVSSALGNYVAKTGDTMTGTLTNTASVNVNGSIMVGYGGVGRFQIQNGASGNAGYAEFVNPGGTRIGYIGFGSGTNSINYVAEASGNNHNFTGNILVSGNVVASGNVTAFSDERLKTDIVRIDGALDKVDELMGVLYTRKDTGERGTGLIAQHVERVLPEGVQHGEYLSVAYGNLVGLLVEAIKELRQEVQDIKTKLA